MKRILLDFVSVFQTPVIRTNYCTTTVIDQARPVYVRDIFTRSMVENVFYYLSSAETGESIIYYIMSTYRSCLIRLLIIINVIWVYARVVVSCDVTRSYSVSQLLQSYVVKSFCDLSPLSYSMCAYTNFSIIVTEA